MTTIQYNLRCKIEPNTLLFSRIVNTNNIYATSHPDRQSKVQQKNPSQSENYKLGPDMT